MLLRLAYLTITNAFAALPLLPMSDRDKAAEILALRHQIMLLERQLGTGRVKFTSEDRAFLVAPLAPLPREVLRRLRLLVQPDTVLRWHRDLIRVRTAMSSQARPLPRRTPPYRYLIGDAGPHPNPAKAAAGQQIHRLEPDPTAAPIVARIFQMYVDGMSDKAIATRHTREGIPCPSAHDAARNPHRKKSARQAGAVRAILINPRYTGYEIWNKQRKEEHLYDVDDVTLGHRTRMTNNPADQWEWSNDAAHEAIVTTQLFDTVKKIRQQRARAPQRIERPGRERGQGQRAYALRGRVRCKTCGRKMQPATIHNTVYHRCECKEQEQSLHPGLEHPRTVYLREDVVCRALDRWIAKAFAPDRLAATLTALAHPSAAAHAAETLTPEQAQARKTVKKCERRLARYQSALEAGPDPAVVTQWINEAQADKETARKRLDAPPAAARKKETPLTADQIGEITERLGDIAQRVHAVDAEKKGPLYEALGITISYEHAPRAATVRSRPSSAYRHSECPRGELTADDTVLVAQGKLYL
ncbi:recombinase family protein [Streptomyces sp. NPDC004533]|uniref:recombinase family protein n=1 Tax=Streptomyces sp. NPDC004533 TaxID=3154278 RepID=UPI0033B95F58